MSDLFEKFLNSLTLEEETDYELAERMEQFKKETTERVSEDFEIQIKIAVYSTSGEFSDMYELVVLLFTKILEESNNDRC